MTTMKIPSVAILVVLSAAAASVLTGCGVGTSTLSTAPIATSGAAIQGTVHGGQQPVIGATIQLYATGTSGYGSAASPLIASPTKTGAGGAFSLGTYSCPTANPAAPVYLVATGGTSSSTTNANLALMAALGPCNNLASLSFVSLNELTTVASVYALAPFMAGPANAYTKVGTSANNAMGLKNALADVNVLVNLATGTTPGSTTVAGLTLPTSEINTLADIIAACVNSAGGSYNDGSACGTLFANADPGGTAFTAPTDTITALMNIAQHPATSTANLAALYTLATPTAPFQPTLTSQPKDFTLALTFAGATNAPSALAADAAGNVWITNVGNNTVTELAHTGVVLSGAGYTASLAHPNAIAFAPDGTAWITNAGNSTVSRLTPTGAAYPGSPYSGGGLDVPRSIAFDSSGTAWIANNISVTTINSAGSTLTNYAPSAVTGNIVAIAVNPH